MNSIYSKFSRRVRNLKIIKLELAESHVCSLLDNLGPVREMLTQSQNNWEECRLEDAAENLRRYMERNPVQAKEIK